MAIFDWITDKLKSDISELQKADGVVNDGHADALPDIPETDHDAKKQIGRQAIIEDPYFDQISQGTIYKSRASRLSNKTLRDVSVRDWTVSAIIQQRVDTLLRFSRPEHDKFRMGFKFVKWDKKSDVTKEDLENIANLEDFVYNCGRKDNVPHDDRMLFGEFLKKIVRDALTYGHVSIEKIKTKRGGLHRIRPLPAESVYLVNKQVPKQQIQQHLATTKRSTRIGPNDPKQDQVVNKPEVDYYKYVQMGLDQSVLAAFGDEDLIFKLFNPQNFMDSMGYCYSPLELAIINVTNHLNVENYNANFFTHGYAAKGILHLKGTVTQSQLTAFRRQFYNNINGAQHAWKTPIIAGLDEVEWVSLAGNAKEMEYISFNDHLLRSICAQFQIDPIEIGMDYLSKGPSKAAGQKTSNEEKIEYSRERGLHPILMFIEDMINCDVVPAIDKSLADKYRFQFVGYEDDTPQTQVAQLQAEMTVHSSMNDLLKAAQKEVLDIPGMDVPLNQAFWAVIEKNLTRGEIREYFFGDKDASKKKELQYIPGDPAFMGWQQMIMTIEQQKKQEAMQKQQMDAEAEAADKEHAREDQKHQREQEAHDMEMERQKAAAAQSVVSPDHLKETAKSYGVGDEPLNIGGTPVGNPINKSEEE